MKQLLLVCLMIATTAIFPIRPLSAQAETPFLCDPGQSALPSNDPKYPASQLILICKPTNWNGDLIVYAHGYTPVQEPLALPLKELTLSDGMFVPEVLLAQGFAFATSSYHKNGAATEQAHQDLLSLLGYFETLIQPGSLKKVFIIGASEGGLIALQLLEQNPNRFDAGLALCAPVGGAAKQIKYFADFRVVFDYFFPGIFPFGAFNVPPDAINDWPSVYMSRIIGAMRNDPAATLQLFSVTRAAVDPVEPATFIETALDILFYSILVTPDLISTAGGVPYDNRFTLYLGLTDNLALNRGVERIRGDRNAERYAKQFYQTTGDLKRPLVTLHTTLDPIVALEHELVYRALTRLQHKQQFFTLLTTERYGHCDFTTSEILNSLGVMLLQAEQAKLAVN